MQLNVQDRGESRIREAFAAITHLNKKPDRTSTGHLWTRQLILYLREESPVSIGYVLLSHTATE